MGSSSPLKLSGCQNLGLSKSYKPLESPNSESKRKYVLSKQTSEGIGPIVEVDKDGGVFRQPFKDFFELWLANKVVAKKDSTNL